MMSQLRWQSLAKGLATFVPQLGKLANGAAGSAVSSRYFYSVWLRHLVSVAKVRPNVSWNIVAELGPGDSLGLGICSLLSGASRYIGLDRLDFSTRVDNVAILEELYELFLRQEPIPGEDEFPGVYPRLSDYRFPHHLLTPSILASSLSPQKISELRHALSGDMSLESGSLISYAAPWDGAHSIGKASIDLMLSQAVMEHVDDVDAAYSAMHRWLKIDGIMSHRIDYTSHGITKDWYGHWTLSKSVWKLIRGQRAYLINRLPHSAHIEALVRNSFRIVDCQLTESSVPVPGSAMKIAHLAEDLTIRGAFIVAERSGS